MNGRDKRRRYSRQVVHQVFGAGVVAVIAESVADSVGGGVRHGDKNPTHHTHQQQNPHPHPQNQISISNHLLKISPWTTENLFLARILHLIYSCNAVFSLIIYSNQERSF